MEENLNKTQRLILLNQYQILSEITDDVQMKKVYQNNIKILENGYARLYSVLYELVENEELSRDDTEFINDVLDMYSKAMVSYEALNEEDKNEQLEQLVRFKGFDLNDPQQSKFVGYIDFMINDYERWEDIKRFVDEGTIELNSHGFGLKREKLENSVNKYKAILKERDTTGELTVEELKDIFQ